MYRRGRGWQSDGDEVRAEAESSSSSGFSSLPEGAKTFVRLRVCPCFRSFLFCDLLSFVFEDEGSEIG